MKILYIFNATPGSGYWQTMRDNVKALTSVGADVVLRDINKKYLPKDIEELGRKSSVGADVCIQHMLPCFMEKTPIPSVGLYYSECNKLSLGWHKYLNCMDHLIFANQQMAHAAQRSLVTTPFSVIPACTNTSRFLSSYRKLVETEAYVFYYVAEVSMKKNIFALCKAFLCEFGPEATLVLKINPAEAEPAIRQEIENVKKILAHRPINKYQDIHIISDNLTDEQMNSLHWSSNCFVLPSRAESVSLPLMSAVGFGKDIVYCKGSGHPEYVNEDIGYPVDFTFTPANQLPFYTPHMNWCDISVPDLQKQMRAAYNNRGSKAKNAMIFAQKNYTYKRFGTQMLNALKGVIKNQSV